MTAKDDLQKTLETHQQAMRITMNSEAELIAQMKLDALKDLKARLVEMEIPLSSYLKIKDAHRGELCWFADAMFIFNSGKVKITFTAALEHSQWSPIRDGHYTVVDSQGSTFKYRSLVDAFSKAYDLL